MDDVLPFLIPILGIIVGGLTVLIPVVGLTARFAAKPIVEMIIRAREQQAGPRVELLEKRFEAMEQQLERLDISVQRLVEEREFERRLAAAQPGGLLPEAPPGRGAGGGADAR